MILWCPDGGLYAATGQARRPAAAASPALDPAPVVLEPAPALAVAS